MVFGDGAGQHRHLVPMRHLHIFGPHVVVHVLHILGDERQRVFASVEYHAALQCLAHPCQSLQPSVKAMLVLSPRWHRNLYAAYGVEWLLDIGHDDLARESVEERLVKVAPELGRDVPMTVQADDDLRCLKLVEGVYDTTGNVGRDAHLRLHHHIHRGGILHHVFQQFAPFLHVVLGMAVVVDHVQTDESTVEPLVAHHHPQAHQVVGNLRILHGYEYLLIVCHCFLWRRVPAFEHHLLGGPLGGHRAVDAGDEYEDDGAVEHIVVEQSLAVGHDEVVAHQHGSQRGPSLCIAQPEDHLTLEGLQSEGLLRHPRGHPFRHQRHNDHDACHLECAPSAEQRPDVDQHAHADEEVGDEDGIAHKLQTIHQSRHPGDIAVEHQSGEKGAQQSLQVDELHHQRTEKHQCQHKDKLYDDVLVVYEELAGHAWEEEDDERKNQGRLEHQQHAKPPGDVAIGHGHDDVQGEQGERVGECRGPHGDGHAAFLRQSEPHDGGVGNERVRGIHAGQQDRGDETIVQHRRVEGQTHEQRYGKSQQAVGDGLGAVVAHVFHVHLQGGKQHDEIEAHVAEDVERAVFLEDAQPVRTDQRSGQHHAYDVRYAQLAHDDRSHEDNQQHHKENERRIGDGEV